MEIYSYNDHRSAPSPEPVGWFCHLQLYLGCGSRHCHGINYTQNPVSWPPALAADSSCALKEKAGTVDFSPLPAFNLQLAFSPAFNREGVLTCWNRPN